MIRRSGRANGSRANIDNTTTCGAGNGVETQLNRIKITCQQQCVTENINRITINESSCVVTEQIL